MHAHAHSSLVTSVCRAIFLVVILGTNGGSVESGEVAVCFGVGTGS